MTATHAPQTPPPSLATGASLLHTMAQNWWLVVLRGVHAVARDHDVAAATRFAQAGRYDAQNAVAFGMAVGIVEELKVV